MNIDRRWKLVLTNGAIVEVPEIAEAAAWYYRPDEARTQKEIDRGTNKSFGRSRDGALAAKEWLRQHLKQEFEKHDWSPVAKIGFPSQYNSHDQQKSSASNLSGGMVANYFDTALGWQTLKLTISGSNGTTGNTQDLQARIEWTGWNFQKWFFEHQVHEDDIVLRTPLRRVMLDTAQFRVSQDKAYEVAGRFAKNPIETFEHYRKVTSAEVLHFPRRAKWDVPLTWPDKPNLRNDPFDAADGVELQTDQEHIFWRNRQNIEKVLIDSRSQLDVVAKMLSHLGVNTRFDVRSIYDRNDENYGKSYLESVQFQVPRTSDDNNRLGHSFTFSSSGIRVECGYVEDEERWEDIQKRHMADWLTEMTDTTETKEYEEYEYTPNV